MPGSPEFESLRSKWYRKINKAGFEDIEKDGQINCWDSHYFQAQYTPEKFVQKKKYFERASDLEEKGIFLDNVEKRIWELHVKGTPIRMIVTVLKAEKIKRNKNQVNQVINDLQDIMARI